VNGVRVEAARLSCHLAGHLSPIRPTKKSYTERFGPWRAGFSWL